MSDQAEVTERPKLTVKDFLRPTDIDAEAIAERFSPVPSRPKPPSDSIRGPQPGPQPSPIPDRDPLLALRELTHGNYSDVAKMAQGLKTWMRYTDRWTAMPDVERESLEMIVVKMARILCGKPLEKTHWEDIVGYAKLVLEKCE